MAYPSPTDLLTLHAVRLKGFADTDAVAARFDLDADQAHENLLDAQALGRVTRSSFAELTAWSLTEAGRRHNEAQLHDELDRAGAREAVAGVHEAFVPLNGRATGVLTAWQLEPEPARRAGVFRQLADLADELRPCEGLLTEQLTRFAGYHRRFATALDRARDDPQWITGIEVDSCHRVWFELHEDLIATLGVTR